MKKIILAIILLIVAGLGIGPYFVGSQVESLMNKNMEQTNALLAQQLKGNVFKVNYQITSYNKGYLGSDFDSQIVVSVPNEEDLIIPFKNTIKHGPVAFDGGVFLGTAIIHSHLDAANLPADKPEFITDDFLTSVSKIDFAGNYDSDVKVKAVSYNEEGSQSDFKGIDANFKGSLKDVNSYDISAKFNGLDSNSGNEQVNVSPFTVSGSRSKDGKINFTTDKITVNGDTVGEGANTFSMDSLTANGTQIWSDNLSTYTGRVDVVANNLVATGDMFNLIIDKVEAFSNVEETTADNFKFAYGVNLTPNKESIKALSAQSPLPITPENLTINIEIDNLPNTLVKDYTELLTQLQEDPEAIDEQALQAKGQEMLLSVLNNGVKVKKNLVFKAEEGSTSIDADVKILDDLNLTVDSINELAMAQSPQAILALIAGKVFISFDENLAVASGADMFIAMYGNGLIKQNPQTGAYEADVVVQDGVLTVNGQAIPLP